MGRENQVPHSSVATGQEGGTRVFWIDQIRGSGICLMIIYHFLYDLRALGVSNVIHEDSSFWKIGHVCIAGIFFYACGAGQRAGWVLKKGGFGWWRFFQVVGAAMAVSVATFLVSPDNWIHFGILHAIAFCILVTIPLRRFPSAAGFLSLSLGALFLLTGWTWSPLSLSKDSLDYVVVFPWIAVVLAGMASFSVLDKALSPYSLNIPNRAGKTLRFLGRRSLALYLLHQPVLIFLAFGLRRLQTCIS